MSSVNIHSPATIREVLEEAESFVVAFENDDQQEGIDYLLRRVRSAISALASTKEERAANAEVAISAYTGRTHCDHEDSLGDLLTDLMHWARFNKFDFDLALVRAQMHFDAEP